MNAERRRQMSPLEKLIDQLRLWIPSVVVMVTVIVFGVRIDDQVAQNTKDIYQNTERLDYHDQRLDRLDTSMAEIKVLLKSMNDKIDRMVKELDHHLKDAEQWKRRIIKNEMNNGNNQ